MFNYDQIIEIEKDPKILDFKFSKSKISMYLIIRQSLLQLLIDKKFNLSSPQENTKFNVFDFFLFSIHAIFYGLFFAPKKDIYVFSSDVVYNDIDGKNINRLYEDFVNTFPNKTQLILKSSSYKIIPKKTKKVYYDFPIKLISYLVSKLRPINKEDIKTANNLLSYISDKNFELSEDNLKELKKTLLINSNLIDYKTMLYEFFLKYKKPKLIIVEDAHYINGTLSLIKTAKKLGITVAEYQHGFIAPGHRAYNFHENIQPLIKNYLPDYFLTFGQYWSNSVNLPAKKINIGNLNLSNFKISPYTNSKKNQILIISGGTVYEKLIEFILNIKDKLMELGFQIVLRPHPLELLSSKNRYDILEKHNIVLDKHNLYESLSKSAIVVSMEVSTVLFEAIIFTKKIYLIDNEYSSFYQLNLPFLSFKDENSILVSIKNNDTINSDANFFWENKPLDNYRKFIQSVI